MKKNEQLLGGIFSAFDGFSGKYFGEKIQDFSFSAHRIHYFRKKPFIFVGIYSKEIPTIVSQLHLKDLGEQFYNTYIKLLPKDWDSDLGFFSNFKKLLYSKK